MLKELGNYADLIGVPFVEFGRDAKNGLDCYGLAVELYRRNGIVLRDVALEKFDFNKVRKEEGKLNVRRIDKIQDGALLEFYGKADDRLHIGVVLHGDTFIHATENQGVRISTIKTAKYLQLKNIYEVI